MSDIRVFTAFSGYDSQLMALDRLSKDFPNFGYTPVGWSEIDDSAIEAHNICFPALRKKNYGDICKINWAKVPDFDLLTYSSPCQDFSHAGEKQGGEKGSGTRSSLLWEVERAIKAKKPKYLLMENVPAIERYPTFHKWLKTLEKLGYNNYHQVLNAADFGVPQKRKRMFVVSVCKGGGTIFHNLLHSGKQSATASTRLSIKNTISPVSALSAIRITTRGWPRAATRLNGNR